MLSRSLFARSSPLRLSAALTTRVCSRSLSTLRLAQPARCAAPSCANLRRFSAAPAFRTENRDSPRASHTPSGTCYIANIPYKVTAEELKDAFSDFGKVASVRLLTSDGGLSRGVGFVQFESVADAVSFVDANEADPIFVLDRQLHVEHAQKSRNASGPAEPSDTLMVLRFQGELEAEVREMFGSHADNVLAVRFNKREANQPSRKAFIQFRNVDMATEAMDAFRNQNEDIQITYARQRQPPANAYTLTSRLSQYRGQ
ncbi:RNA-binding domain-containing protein [Imleria badia]|nr:RNA-binding domain-containing protein [Imleria badia]